MQPLQRTTLLQHHQPHQHLPASNFKMPRAEQRQGLPSLSLSPAAPNPTPAYATSYVSPLPIPLCPPRPTRPELKPVRLVEPRPVLTLVVVSLSAVSADAAAAAVVPWCRECPQAKSPPARPYLKVVIRGGRGRAKRHVRLSCAWCASRSGVFSPLLVIPAEFREFTLEAHRRGERKEVLGRYRTLT